MTWTAADVEAVRNATFKSTSFLKRGYDMEQVDDFLDEVVECMQEGRPLPDPRDAQFDSRSGGYHEAEVDRFLLHLNRHDSEQRAAEARAGTDEAAPRPTGPVVGTRGPEPGDIALTPLEESEAGELVAFLTGNRFPFHMQPAVTEQQAQSWIAEGRFAGSGSRTLWIDARLGGSTARLGLVVLEGLDDPTPMFDLRLAEQYRGRGYAVPVMKALTRLVFTSMPQVRRFEGQTREDNIAMRKTLLRCGFLKEAHYREGWPLPDGRYLASVAYTILRRDWETGRTTPFDWEDLAG